MNQTHTISEHQITKAMRFFEARAGQRDGISIPKEVSKLADVLGVMWHDKTSEAVLDNDHPVCTLLFEAGVIDDVADSDDEGASAESPSP